MDCGVLVSELQNQQQKAVMASLRAKGLLNHYENLDVMDKDHVMKFAGLPKTNFDLSNAKLGQVDRIAEGIRMNKLLHIKLSKMHESSMISSAKYEEMLKDKFKGVTNQKLAEIFYKNQHSNQELAGEVHAEMSRRERHGQRNVVRYPSDGSPL